MSDDQPNQKIRCDACPVMCYIAPGQTGACDRYGNAGGRIARTEPVVMLLHTIGSSGAVCGSRMGA